MPGFIKTPADEKKWNAIKHSVAKQRGKSTENFTDRDWATVNAAWHKSEIQDIKKSLKIPGALKMPKTKRLPDSTDKPSVFFKKEEFSNVKKPSIENLRSFLERNRSKK
jgi:hypothetical protein